MPATSSALVEREHMPGLRQMVELLGERHDPAAFFPSLGHQDCLERLSQGLIEGQAALVTGDAGVGKTLVSRVLTDRTTSSWIAIELTDSDQLHTDVQLLRRIIHNLDGQPGGRSGLELAAQISSLTRTVANTDEPLLLVIDDAHLLTSSQLEALRTLLNGSNQGSHLTILLAGAPELLTKIQRKRQLNNRIVVRHVLNPVNRDDAESLLHHRLQLTAQQAFETLITSDAMDVFYQRAMGIPRTLLQDVQRGLILADAEGSLSIGRDLATRAIASAFDAGDQMPLPMFEPGSVGDSGSRA